MSKKNIFDLTKLIPHVNNDVEIKKQTNTFNNGYVPKQISTEDQEKLLQGYSLVTEEEWDFLTNGVRIRYLKKDGQFRKGGILKGMWRGKNNNKVEKMYLTSVSNPPINWSINMNNIDKIWKENIESNTSNTEITDLEDRVEYLELSLEELKKQIQKLQNNNVEILKIVKKMYGH